MDKEFWFEVFEIDEEGYTESLHIFEEEEDAKDYIRENPKMSLGYDKWFLSTKTKENTKF